MIELPKLDDRTYADFVAAARASIPSLAPAWTDHNASDPGIALVEVLAWLSEIVMYRIDRVPDRSYRTFLQLLSGAPPTDTKLEDAIRTTLLDLRERHRAVTLDDYEYFALQLWSRSAEALKLGAMGTIRRARGIGEHSKATLGAAWKDPHPKAGESHVTVVVVSDEIGGTKSFASFAQERRYALDLDGVAAYVDCGNDKTLQITGPLTVSAWVFPRKLANKGRQGIVSKDAAGEFELYLEPDGTVGFHHADGSEGAMTTARLAVGQWAHVAAVRSADGKSLLLYVDGEHAGSAVLAKQPTAMASPVVIGRLSSGSGYFDGLVRDVSIWNIARGALEVGIDMRRVPPGVDDTRAIHPPPALPVACWRLDQPGVHRDPAIPTSPLVTPDAETASNATVRPRDGVVSSTGRWQDVMRPLATSQFVLGELGNRYDQARLLTTRVDVIDYRPLPVTVTAEIYLRSDGVKADVAIAANAAIERVIDPLRGWDGKGWPFDRPIYNSDLGSALDKLPGVDFVDGVEVSLVGLDVTAEANKDRKRNPRDESGNVIGVSLQPDELPNLVATTLNLYHRVGTRWQLLV